jgi:hypothetical protein
MDFSSFMNIEPACQYNTMAWNSAVYSSSSVQNNSSTLYWSALRLQFRIPKNGLRWKEMAVSIWWLVTICCYTTWCRFDGSIDRKFWHQVSTHVHECTACLRSLNSFWMVQIVGQAGKERLQSMTDNLRYVLHSITNSKLYAWVYYFLLDCTIWVEWSLYSSRRCIYLMPYTNLVDQNICCPFL